MPGLLQATVALYSLGNGAAVEKWQMAEAMVFGITEWER